MDALLSLILDTTLWIMFLQPYIPFLKHPLSINLIVNLPRIVISVISYQLSVNSYQLTVNS